MLSPEEMQRRLASCPGWTVVTSPLPDDASKTRTELHRPFRFASFDEALAFMQAAAPFINTINHHPRWENAFKTLNVWLSTWDSGHVISERDFELARHFNQLWDEREGKR
jgi:pterin-4a-carbinolamine dehydratase